MKEIDLVNTVDAVEWAKEFVRIAKTKPEIPIDEGTMLGWFANAIMTGYDHGRTAERKDMLRMFTYINHVLPSSERDRAVNMFGVGA